MSRQHAFRSSAGVTLIELLVSMAVLAIITAIAYPSYTSFVQKSNRSDATAVLLLDAQSLQRCYSQNFSYLTNCNVVSGTTASPQGYYNINVNITSTTAYTLTATPAKAPQTGDSTCAQFQLLSTGQQLANNSGGTNTSTTCWNGT